MIGTLTEGPEKAPEKTVQSITPKKKALMHVGCQKGGTSKENLEFFARHGVYHIDGGSPRMIEGVGWDRGDSLAINEGEEQSRG